MLAFPTAVNVPLRTEEGVIRIGKSRVTLQAVIADFHRGASPEEIAHHFPALTLTEVYLVIGYYLHNRDEVDEYIRQQRDMAEQARQEYQAAYPNDALRTRLLAALEERRQQEK